jgi:hypothetical protein
MSKGTEMDAATAVKERPMIFSGPMVKAILAGNKTQTRRVIRNPEKYSHIRDCGFCCPHGQPGDRLWVRETWSDAMSDDGPVICYRANLDRRYLHFDAWPIEYDRYPECRFANWASDLERGIEGHWRSLFHMPRWAARIILEITDVRVQRLQEINEADARAEGFPIPGTQPCIVNGEPGEVTFFDPRTAFAYGWNAINSKRPGCAWIDNPWTWAITFKRLKP